MERADGQAEWKDAPAYAALLEADRSIIAWEWLRRDPEYRAAARGASPRGPGPGGTCRQADRRAAAWGLHAFEPAELPAPLARPLWRAEAHPSVLRVAARAARPGDEAFSLRSVAELATQARARGGHEHWLFSEGLRTVRLDVTTGSLARGPVHLEYALAGIACAERQIFPLRQWLALCRSGSFARSLHRPETRASRWIVLLRTCDALAAGATQREIAAALLDPAAPGARWRSEAPSLRLRAQRLVRGARAMAGGGYRALLA